LVMPGVDAFAITAIPQPEARAPARSRSAMWFSP
jgi:hypothetical protein